MTNISAIFSKIIIYQYRLNQPIQLLTLVNVNKDNIDGMIEFIQPVPQSS